MFCCKYRDTGIPYESRVEDFEASFAAQPLRARAQRSAGATASGSDHRHRTLPTRRIAPVDDIPLLTGDERRALCGYAGFVLQRGHSAVVYGQRYGQRRDRATRAAAGRRARRCPHFDRDTVNPHRVCYVVYSVLDVMPVICIYVSPGLVRVNTQ